MRVKLNTFILFMSLSLFAAPAISKVVKKDTDNDGQPDRTAYFSASGKLMKLEVDENEDGFCEAVQEYVNGDLATVRRDTDNNKKYDCFDQYNSGVISCQELFTEKNTLLQVIEFDTEGKIQKSRRDGTGDGHLETESLFEDGEIVSSCVDEDGNGISESSIRYEKGVIAMRTVDADQNQIPEDIYYYDSKGQIIESDHDDNGDGQKTIHRKYSEGQPVRQERSDAKGRVVELVLYEAGHPVRLEKDSTSDGIRDLLTLYKGGRPVTQKQDTTGDGQFDTVRSLEPSGVPHLVRKDTNSDSIFDTQYYLKNGQIFRSESDGDHDGRKETVCSYASGKMKELKKDINGDKRIDHLERYSVDGQCIAIESDTNNDGNIDSWQSFKDGNPLLMKADETGDGKVDTIIHFASGEKVRLERDADADGLFEVVQQYNKDGWGMILTQDADGDGNPEAKLCYSEGVLREKTYYLPDGLPESVEYFDVHGQLTKSEERENSGLSLTWFYDALGQTKRAERDKDLDGVVEEIFYYRQGAIYGVEEDTNADGKSDIWEEYDTKGNITASAKDMDYDGEPDLVKGRWKRQMDRMVFRNSI
ncbi:MAG: hypothetical protein ACNI27_02640 [Desulfovibrio sp.]